MMPTGRQVGIHVVSADGLRLVGDVVGEGAATIVLAHGGGQARHAWRGLSLGLTRLGYRVVRYDMRGHGDSEWPANADYSLPALAADLHAVAAATGANPIVVGASIGGLAGFYAAANGLRATALVLVDTALRPSAAGTARIRTFMADHVSGFDTLDHAVAAVAAFRGSPGTAIRKESVARSLRPGSDGRWRWHWDPRFLSQAEDLCGRGDLLAAAAPGVRIPVALLRGSDSDIVDDEAVATMAALVPQLETIRVAGASHMGSGDDNDAYGGALIDHVAKLACPAGTGCTDLCIDNDI